MKRQTRFIIGSALGLIIAGIVLALFATTYSQSSLSSPVLSTMTFLGLGISIVGYLIQRRGESSMAFDYIFGFGVGMMIVSFFGTMNGTLTIPF